jgi:diacylglycerol kinase (ATP)
MRLGIISNKRSGNGKPEKVLREFISYLDAKGIAWRIVNEQEVGPLVNIDRLVIIGGDGTINFTLNRFMPLTLPVAIIPAGTGNDFAAMHLGKVSMIRSFEIAIAGCIKSVDAGLCNGKIFLNGIGIGFDGAIAGKLMHKKWFKGPSAYYAAVLAQILFFKSFRAKVSLSETTIENSFLMLCIANGTSYGGGFKVAPLAKAEDGLLDYMAVAGINPLKRLLNLPKIRVGKHLNLPDVHYQLIEKIHINSRQMLPAHADGEYFESNTFEMSLLKGYLSLLS